MRVWAMLVVIGAAMMMGGCAVVPWAKDAPGFGFVVYDVKGDPAPYVLVERGKEKRVYGAEAGWWAYWYPLPFWVVEAGRMGPQLFDHRVRWWDIGAAYGIAWGPRRRTVSVIRELAQGVAPAPYWVGEGKQTEAAKRWILGNEPLVIAIGTDRGPIDWDGGTYALAREGDLDRTATELLVLEKWPKPWKYTGSEWEKAFEAELAKVTRRVKLERPVTLREIVARRMWER